MINFENIRCIFTIRELCTNVLQYKHCILSTFLFSLFPFNLLNTMKPLNASLERNANFVSIAIHTNAYRSPFGRTHFSLGIKFSSGFRKCFREQWTCAPGNVDVPLKQTRFYHHHKVRRFSAKDDLTFAEISYPVNLKWDAEENSR